MFYILCSSSDELRHSNTIWNFHGCATCELITPGNHPSVAVVVVVVVVVADVAVAVLSNRVCAKSCMQIRAVVCIIHDKQIRIDCQVVCQYEMHMHTPIYMPSFYVPSIHPYIHPFTNVLCVDLFAWRVSATQPKCVVSWLMQPHSLRVWWAMFDVVACKWEGGIRVDNNRSGKRWGGKVSARILPIFELDGVSRLIAGHLATSGWGFSGKLGARNKWASRRRKT